MNVKDIYKSKWSGLFKHNESFFALSALVVNAVNYSFNLLLSKWLIPEYFSEVALIITMLLVLSFIGNTFQLLVTKFIIELDSEQRSTFVTLCYCYTSILGLIVGGLFFIFSHPLMLLLQTSTNTIFQIFSLCIPIYFLLCIRRGIYQGQLQFKRLAWSYQLEVWAKFIGTFLLICTLNLYSSVAVAWSILGSLLLSHLAFHLPKMELRHKFILSSDIKKRIYFFFGATILYELTQITINNSDIILVKMFFSNYESGLYSCLALFGRMVYFSSWIIVMTLMPNVIIANKKGEKTLRLLYKYMFFISLFCAILILFSYFFNRQIVGILFGSQYVSVSNLLTPYTIASSLFTLSNIIIYYQISVSNYRSVFIAFFAGVFQVFFIFLYHQSLFEVIFIQIILNLVLLAILSISQYLDYK